MRRSLGSLVPSRPASGVRTERPMLVRTLLIAPAALNVTPEAAAGRPRRFWAGAAGQPRLEKRIASDE
jgi:hypothetical protein